VTVAIMNGCGVQWYAKTPGASNVYEKIPPGMSVPESNTPSSDVTVCGVSISLFVQHTVVPTGTVSVSGA